MDSDTRLKEYNTEQVKGFILGECFHTGKFKLSCGNESDYYINTNPLSGMQLTRGYLTKSLSLLAQKSIKSIKVEYPLSYIGMENGGISLALLAANHDNVMFGYLRKTRKDHGLETLLEHPYSKVRGVLFEDVINSGDTIRNSLKLADNFTCYSILCIVNRNGINKIDGIPIHSMISTAEIKRMIEYKKRYLNK